MTCHHNFAQQFGHRFAPAPFCCETNMKKCLLCGNYYEDVYTMCRDGGRLVPTSDPVPSLPANDITFRPVQADGPSLPPNVNSSAKRTDQRHSLDRPTGSPEAGRRQKSISPLGPTPIIPILVFLGLIASAGGFSVQATRFTYPVKIGNAVVIVVLPLILFASVALLTGSFRPTKMEEIEELSASNDSARKKYPYIRCGRWACGMVMLFWAFFYHMNAEMVALNPLVVVLMFTTLALGLLLSLVALWGMMRYGARQIAGSASTGLVFNGIFLCLLLALHSEVVKHKEESTHLQQTVDQMGGEARQMLAATTPEEVVGAFQNSEQTLATAVGRSSGQTKAFMEALARFTKKSASVVTNLPRTDDLIKKGMDMTDIETLEQFRAKRAMVLEACDIMEEAASFDENFEKNFRTELQTIHLPPEVVGKLVAAYRPAIDACQPVGLALDGYAQSFRAMADLMEAGWGKWTFHKKQKTFTFNDISFAADYNTALKSCKAANQNLLAAITASRLATKKLVDQQFEAH